MTTTFFKVLAELGADQIRERICTLVAHADGPWADWASNEETIKQILTQLQWVQQNDKG